MDRRYTFGSDVKLAFCYVLFCLFGRPGHAWCINVRLRKGR